jgi:RNA polymerase sigma factor (sigma-70 family)
MAKAQAEAVLRHFRTMFVAQRSEHLPDADLVRRMVDGPDEAAFTVIVRRHGDLVLKACRRVLQRDEDAEDAFQATFLILARNAARIRKRVSLASWLHGVAVRCALDLRKAAMRRRKHEKNAEANRPCEQPASRAALHELQALLDEEVQRLPEKYRAPFVYCCLEGKSRAEACQALGWKDGTVASRLAKAREILQKRLLARGVTLSAALSAVAISTTGAAAMSPGLARRAIDAGLAYAAGGAVAGPVLTVAEGVLKSMLVAKLKLGMAVMFTAFLAAFAVGGFVAQPDAGGDPPQRKIPIDPPPQAPKARAEPEKSARVDSFGDPLPDGAIARLGTRRFRHDGYASSLAFTPDGKLLAGFTYSGVVVWEAATGIERYRVPAQMPHLHSCIGISADGSTLAITEHVEREIQITLRDIDTGKKSRTITLPNTIGDFNHQFDRLIFSPDGKSLVLSRTGDGGLLVFDVPSGTIRLTLGGTGSRFYHTAAISPDSTSLAVVVADKPNPNDTNTINHAVQLLDIATGKLVRELDKKSIYGNLFVVAFSPDGKTLACSNYGKVKLLDSASGKTLGELKDTKGPRDLAFTPDGSRLVFYDHEEGGIHIWDIATKKSVHALKGRLHPGSSMALSPDGKVVALGTHSSVIRLWETDSGKELFTEHQGHESTIKDLVFSPDGKTLASTAELAPIVLWDTSTWQKKGALPLGSRVLSFSPDGKRLATIEAEAGYVRKLHSNKVRVWDVATGTETTTLSTAAVKYFEMANFSADGKIFSLDRRATDADNKSCIRHWDVRTGTHERIAIPTDYHDIAFFPNGQSIIATRYATKGESRDVLANVVMRDLASGKERFIGPVNDDLSRRPTLSADGRMLALAFSKRTERWWDHAADVRVCDIVTGKEVFLLPGQKYSESSLAWSPDGRILATGTDRHDHMGDVPVLVPSIRLWDMATGKEFAKWGDIHADVAVLAFSPNGNTLVAGLRNGTLLVFDASKLAPPSRLARPLSQVELEAHWTDLASDDKAQRAIWALVDAAQQTSPFLKDRLKPIPVADAARIKRLIADLDNATFAVREAARKELDDLGEQAEPPLRAALKDNIPLETRRRLLQILGDSPRPRVLRALRAIAVLERIGTTEAVVTLETLTKGASATRTTDEAAATLARMRGENSLK